MMLKFLVVFLAVTISFAEETDSKIKVVLESGATDESKPNEVYLSPGQNCDIKCSNLGDKCTGSEVVNPPAGWFCAVGYARKASGKCVKQERCKSKFFFKNLILNIYLTLLFFQNQFVQKTKYSLNVDKTEHQHVKQPVVIWDNLVL